MNIVDAIIIGIIIIIGMTGLRNGFFKQAVLTVGTILVFIFSYYLKDYLANFFSYNFPFFNFAGPFYGLKSINIILYQLLAFIIVFILLSSVLVIALRITGVFEKVLNFTVVLGIPSKILGFLLGLVEGYIIVFIALFFLSQPAVNFKVLDESKLMPVIVNSSPGLSNIVSKTNKTVDEIYDLVAGYNKNPNVNTFNYKSVKIMLDNKVITSDYLEKLKEKDKISFPGIDDLINEYK